MLSEKEVDELSEVGAHTERCVTVQTLSGFVAKEFFLAKIYLA
jgi:hypothetical protein